MLETLTSHLKLYINSLVYHRNIFGSSLKVFGNFRKFSENVRERSSGFRNNFGKSSETFGKWSEIFGISSKTPLSVCLYNKKTHYTLAPSYEFYVLVVRAISHSFPALTREILFLPLEHKIHIFSPPCNIVYIFTKEVTNWCSALVWAVKLNI